MEEKIRKYAKFLLTGCLRLKNNDKLFLIAYDLINDFVDIIIDEAKKLGIKEVETLISSPKLLREIYLNNTYEDIIKNPIIDKTKFNKMAKVGYSFLSLSSPIPGYYDLVDKNLLARISSYQSSTIKEYREYQNSGLIKWNISAVPNEVWAQSLALSLDELWNLVFDICLINENDPVASWNNKMKKLANRSEYLNNLKIKKLVYKNSLGTNLEIGLPSEYKFCCADGNNIVNMPTEEVFTSPNRLEVNGIVYSSKDLFHNNSLVQNFWLKFKNGKVIDYDALVGKDILKGIMDTDEGASYLGEVALVDYSSPISKSGVLFKNTLYDENASCHLALGASFRECIKGGLNKSKEEIMALGLNYSREHVDFFIGTKDLEIKAILEDKREVIIFKNGNMEEIL